MELLPVPEEVAMVAAAALVTREERGGGGTARGIVIATALSTGYVRAHELDELRAWHDEYPQAVRNGQSTLLAGLYGGGPARDLWCSEPYQPAQTAAATPASKLAALSEKLNRADRRLTTRLHAATETALAEALRSVGVKLNSRANATMKRSRAAAARVASATAEAAGTITPALLAAAGVTEQELLDRRFDALAATATGWIVASEVRKLRATATALGLDPDQVEAENAERVNRRALAAAAFLAAGLAVLARRALSGHALTPETTAEGEFAGPVPFGLIRGAWNIAATGAVGTPFDESGPGPAPIEQLATRMERAGQTIAEELLAEHVGPVIAIKTWAHGEPDRPFPPHEDLNGASWTDADHGDILAADPGEWPYVEEYEPGDHDGCTCWIDTSYEPYTGDAP